MTAAVSMILDQSKDGLDYTQFVSYLCDTGKILVDIFYQQSMIKKSFIISLLSKSVKFTVKASKPDKKWLYDKKFMEQMREAKIVKIFANKSN